jgi:hypothetical protein
VHLVSQASRVSCLTPPQSEPASAFEARGDSETPESSTGSGVFFDLGLAGFGGKSPDVVGYTERELTPFSNSRRTHERAGAGRLQ